MMRVAGWLVMLAVGMLPLSGCTLARVGEAWVQSKADFSQCTPDLRVRCEPGSEVLATSVLQFLPDAIEVVEKAQFSLFSKPVLVYTYATLESFAKHSGADVSASGAVSLGRLNLSPKLLSHPERTRKILIHELSHLHLQFEMGSLAWARVPSWFHEGLATHVSNGGGAETVSANDALVAFRRGKHFVPEDSAWIIFPKGAWSYGLTPHMYYRQAQMFVAFMQDSNPTAFRKMLVAIGSKTPFSKAVALAYGEDVAHLWARFLSTSL